MTMEDWEFKTARDIGMTARERYRSYQREGGLVETSLRLIWWSGVRLSLTCCHRMEYHGLEHLPQQGTRTQTGEMGSFLPGVGMMVAGTTVPVVPCYIRGAFRACPPSSRLPRLTKFDLSFGMQLDFSELPNRRVSWNKIAEETEQVIRGLMPSADLERQRDSTSSPKHDRPSTTEWGKIKNECWSFFGRGLGFEFLLGESQVKPCRVS